MALVRRVKGLRNNSLWTQGVDVMSTINGLPYYEVVFTEDGSLDTDGGLRAAATVRGISDLFVLSPGWNNVGASARDLYDGMFTRLPDQLGGHKSTSRRAGIIWLALAF